MTATASEKIRTVAGSWVNGRVLETAGPRHQVINPATGAPVAELSLATVADVDKAVAAARAALPEWSRATPVDRSTVLAKLAELMDANSELFIAEEVSQTGKPVRLATEFDVPGSVDNVAFFAGAARHLEGKATAEYSPDHTSRWRCGRSSPHSRPGAPSSSNPPNSPR
jgi:betaine-aldehyde dehydrogenase